MSQTNYILLVEDSKDDALLFRKAIEKAGLLRSGVHHALDGEEAIRYLSGIGPFADRLKFPLPSVVFIDLKMPKVSGLDLLGWIQDEIHPRLFSTVVLTGSDHPSDKSTAASLGADHYWVKPPEINDLVKLLRSLERTDCPAIPRTILMVEDREDDVFLTKRACSHLKPPVRIIHVPDGQSAVNYIAGKEPYTDRKEYPLPDLILMDMGLPPASGLDVLRELNQLLAPAPRLPIVLITGCLSENEESEALALGAAACIEKPFSLTEMAAAMSRLLSRLFPASFSSQS